MKSKIKIGRERVIPFTFRFVGTIIVFALFFYLIENVPETLAISIIIPLSFTLPLMWTSRYVIEIDPDNKTIHDHIWWMGFKTGAPTKYTQLEKIYVNEVGMSQRMTSYGGSVHTSRFAEYKAFIKFDHDTLEIFTGKSRQSILKQMKKIADTLGIPFQNNIDKVN